MLAFAMSQTAGKRDPRLSATQAEISGKSAASDNALRARLCSRCMRERGRFVPEDHDRYRNVCEQDQREDKAARWSRTAWRVQRRQTASISLRPVGGRARLSVGT
eukprot:6202038-Pleurochrysis_carterae.AAC.2